MRMPLIALILALSGCSNIPSESYYRAAVHSTATDARKLKEVVATLEQFGEITPQAAETLNRRLDAIIERAK